MCVGENTSQAASVGFVRLRRTNPARGRLLLSQKSGKAAFSTVSGKGPLALFLFVPARVLEEFFGKSKSGSPWSGEGHPAAEPRKECVWEESPGDCPCKRERRTRWALRGGRTVGPARRVAAPGLECIDRLTCPVMTRAPLPQTCRGTKASVKILLTYDENGAILKRKERGRSHGAAGKAEKGMRAASCGGVPA